MADLLADIAQHADDLCNPMHTVEIFWWHPISGSRTRRVWDQHLPSLLDQLAEAVVPGESYVEEEITRAAFASRPAARLDAVDRLLAIEAGAAVWCKRVKVKARDDAHNNIRALVGAAPVMPSDDQRELRNDLGSWRTWAATVTGWEHPPHAPRAPCPLCSAKGTLRIRLAKETACSASSPPTSSPTGQQPIGMPNKPDSPPPTNSATPAPPPWWATNHAPTCPTPGPTRTPADLDSMSDFAQDEAREVCPDRERSAGHHTFRRR